MIRATRKALFFHGGRKVRRRTFLTKKITKLQENFYLRLAANRPTNFTK